MKITMAMSDLAVTKEIYERLEAYRQSKGLSQEALVENLGISRPTYARLQKGTCSLGTFISVLRELALLEGLDALVPSPSLRPSEIIAAKRSRLVRAHARGVAAGLSRRNNSYERGSWRQSTTPNEMSHKSVKELLANRKKNKA